MNPRIPLLVLAGVLAAAGCSEQRVATPAPPSASLSPAAAVPKAEVASMRDAMTAQRFASVPDRGDLVRYPAARTVRRDGAYTWHRADLSESHARRAIGGTLAITTPAGRQVRFRYERHVEHANGDWTWIGSVVGAAMEEAIVTFGPRAAFGTLAQPGDEPLRLTVRDGVSWLVETDPRQIAQLDNVGTQPREPDFLVAPDLAPRSPGVRMSAAAPASTSPPATATVVNGVTRIDLLLGYTPGFVDYYGGQSQALTRLNNLVDIANEAYVNSQMPTQLRLVRTLLVNYPDATPNRTALEELTGYRDSNRVTPNAVFNPLRAAREETGADLVSLVRRFQTPENDNCGIAWLLGGGRRGLIAPSSEYFGYSVVSDGRDAGTDGKTYLCRDETLAHEVGHNLGSAHDRDTSDGDDNVLQTDEYGVFDYSFGYKTTSAQGNFFTVMAYGDTGQTRYRVFSNPRITTCGGLRCGEEGRADNARSITNTFPSVAAFRAEAVAPPPPPPPPPPKPRVRRDLNLDGRSDIVLHNVNSGELYAWLMNGAAIANGQGNAFLPIGHTAIGSGDFDGDGRVDVVSASSAEVRITYGSATGFGTAAVVAARPPGVWAFAGATDVDGNGKADMIWHHRGSGELYYWLMDGAAIVGGNGNAYLPIGHTAIATADFDGDGRGDVLSANATDVRISFARASGTYSPAETVAARPAAGWAFAGAGDVNADGRADVLWHNLDSGEIYAWLMSGATVAGGQGASFLPAGFAAVTLGDFDGDGREDIVAVSSGEVRVALARPGGFAPAVAINPRPFAGWKFVDNVERQRAPAPNDVDADGRTDVIWHNTASGELYYWLLNGATVVSERGATFLPAGFTSIATGDFNTDERADIVSTNGAEVRLSLALPAGGFAPATVIAARPASSWAFGGLGDIDADGRADILWHNTISGELYYWLMSGSAIVGGQGGAFVPAGHAVIAMGDFNGDGQADVLSANATEVRVSLALATGSFGPSTPVSARPAQGWVLAGAADVNADGRSDVVWHNTVSGELYYWAMSGATISGGQGGAVLPAGYMALAPGDFNADGRADILSSNGSDVRVSLALQTGGFGASVPVRARPPASWLFVAPR